MICWICIGRVLKPMGQFIYDFQTLITGLLAVGAALLAARYAQRQVDAATAQIKVGREQIVAAKVQADRDRASRLRAARSSLPTTLSAICEYAEEAVKTLDRAWPAADRLYPSERTASVYTITAQVPKFPSELTQSLERVVEYTDAEDVAERIKSIMREVQIFMAVTRPLRTPTIISLHDLASYILQAATIYARAESLFTYARKSTPGVNSAPLWERVHAALLLGGVHNDRVTALAQSREERGRPPGQADVEEPH